MTDRYIDFDEARAERRREPVVLHAYGQDFKLPGKVPAAVILDIARMTEEGGGADEMTMGDSLKLLSRVLPQDVLDALLEHDDFDLEDLFDLLGKVMAVYSATGASGEVTSPSRAERRKSSPAGGSSKRTGSVSTAKTSARR